MSSNPTNISQSLLTFCKTVKLLIEALQTKYPKRDLKLLTSYLGRRLRQFFPLFQKVEDLMIAISFLVDNGLEMDCVAGLFKFIISENLQSISTINDVDEFYNKHYKNSTSIPLTVYLGIWLEPSSFNEAPPSLPSSLLGSSAPQSTPTPPFLLRSSAPCSPAPQSTPTPSPARQSFIPRLRSLPSRPLSSHPLPSLAIQSLIPQAYSLSSHPLPSPAIQSPAIKSLIPQAHSLPSRPLSSPAMPSPAMQSSPLPSTPPLSPALPSSRSFTLPLAEVDKGFLLYSQQIERLESLAQKLGALQSLAERSPTPQSLASPSPTPQSSASSSQPYYTPAPQSSASPSQPYYKPTHYTSTSVPLTNDSDNSKGFLERYQVFFENKNLVPSDYTKYPGLNEDYHEASKLNFIYDTSMNHCNSNMFYRSRSRLMVVLPPEIQTLIGIFPLIEESNEAITLDRFAFLTVCNEKHSSAESLNQSREANALRDIMKATVESFYKQQRIFEDSVASPELLFIWISTFFCSRIQLYNKPLMASIIPVLLDA